MQLPMKFSNKFCLYIHKAKWFSNVLYRTSTKAATYWNRWSSERPTNDMDQTIDGWNVPGQYDLLIHQFLRLRVL